ncbi:MAG: division/cell wall cluster transcriptional repressor MraZ [Candidatus Komeilibacteria bacterium]
MFIGEYQYNLDDKNRLLVPAKFRAKLGKGAVVTRGLDNCLFIYPQAEWLKLSGKISDLPIGQAKSRAFARLMLSGAMEVEFDSQGRITLPEYLKSFAGLKKSVVVAGLMNRLEIWDQVKWRKYQTETERDSTEIAENLGSLGV